MTLRRDEVESMLDELERGLPRMIERYETPEAFWPIFAGSVDVILEGCEANDSVYARGRVERLRERALQLGMAAPAGDDRSGATAG
ncbi:MAG: hypothetical protein EOP90_13830 [Lysobacteraceae bacterium]|nr:MAG: hypothetical protein EOP90_13830 [Xanthomonadaceae bacterium]